MRFLAVLGAFWFLAASSSALAQIQVSTQTQRTNFLLYERVDFLVTLINNSDSELVLNNEVGHPWLSFLVSRHTQHNFVPIRQERDSNFKSITLKPNESKTLRVNLTPLFTFREEGDYRASAVIDIPNQGQIVSDNTPFSILKGRTVWSQVHAVDGSERIYSLIRFSPSSDKTEMYLRVEDPARNLVYSNIGLGEVVSFIDPDALFDPQGNLHVMQPISMGTYLYSRTNPDGAIVHQTVFKTFREVRPQLHKIEDGNVTVIGGLEQNPNAPREKLSSGQVALQGPSSPQVPTTMSPDAPSAAPAPLPQTGVNQ